MSVVIETSIGDFTVDLFIDSRPKASFNFLKLCKIKYYSYCLFMDIKKNYVARTGDPTHTGSGGVSIYAHDDTSRTRKKYFSAERVPIIKHSKKGLISMVNNGHDKHGSQFLITLADNLEHLDRQGHTVFGEIVENKEIVEAFNKTLVDNTDCPYKDICVSHTVVLSDPYSDPSYLSKLKHMDSPEIPLRLLDSDRVGIYDDLDEEENRTAEEIEAKEAQEKAILLEMLEDLPNADSKPPENVLFICKLNPITGEEDLKSIFSRFGQINSVNIVRDPKTNQSLQYGFIEFDQKDSCEKAYLKMDNVLLDDRRIHVDFSQSVSKRREHYRSRVKPR